MSKEIQKTENKRKGEFFRYLIIGFSTTFLNWAITLVLTKYTDITETAIGTAVISTIAWTVSTVFFAFWMYKFFVFRSKSVEKNILWMEFAEFVGARLLTWGIEFLILLVVCDTIGFKDDIRIDLNLGINGNTICDINKLIKDGESYIVKLGACVITTIVNYIFSKFVIFKKGQKLTLDEIERDEG